MIPRFGKPPIRGQHYRRRPGAYAILVRDGLLLLTHQKSPVPEYQLPGGGIDEGESAVAALHREVFEETGWSIGGPRFLCNYRRFCWMPDYNFHAEKLCMVWQARPILQRGAPTEAGHIACWATPDNALDLLGDPGSRYAVKTWLQAGGRC
jgi:8-oxo-dGTP diphosphatase